jgi:putative transposase
MARRARLALAGVPWHITQRGNNRAACFFDTQDYHAYLNYLSQHATEFGCAIHAYVLMTNHVHLLLTPASIEGPAQLMKRVGQRYVQHVNRRHKRSGTLWQGRFHSCLTQTEQYVLSCYRYVELNPVRAGMVGHPAQFAWSSFGQNITGEPGGLITPHPEYLALGRCAEARGAAYRRLFEHDIVPADLDAIRQSAQQGRALGGEDFCKAVESMLGRQVKVVPQGRPARAA